MIMSQLVALNCLLRRQYLSSAVNVLINSCHYLRNKIFFLNLFLHFLNQFFRHFEHDENFQNFESKSKFWTFSKKTCLSSLMYFRNYGLRKTWLDKCLKIPASEDPSTSNMINGNKHCWNINDSIFTIFIDHCEGNWVEKSLICKIVRLFVNTLTQYGKYCLLNRDNLLQKFQIKGSQKPKILAHFFFFLRFKI